MASFEDLYAKLYQRNASMHQTFHNMNDAEQNARAQQTKAEREYTEKWEAEWEAEWAKFEANRQRWRALKSKHARTAEGGTPQSQFGGGARWTGGPSSRRPPRTSPGNSYAHHQLAPVYVQHDQDWEAFVKFADSVKPPERSIKLADIPLMQTHLLQAERQNDFFGPLVSLAERKAILKRLVVRWHPDRFMQKFGKKLVDEGQNTVLDRVTEMVQALNLRLNDLAELKY